MRGPAATGRPPAPDQARPALAGLGLLLLVAALVPPLSSEARRVEYVEAVQFALLAVAGPALVVLGAPWTLLRLAGQSGCDDGAHGVPRRFLDLLQGRRRRHPGFSRSLGFLGLDLAAVVVWRLPATVDAVARHSWVAVLEAVSLVACGLGLWLECVTSPPLTPRLPAPERAVLAALAMWALWVTAYLLGLSHGSWYAAYHHVAGHGVSLWADQEITTGVLWLAAASAFIPVIFWNLVVWLRSDDDPDEELHRLVRQGRRRAWAGAGAVPASSSPPSR